MTIDQQIIIDELQIRLHSKFDEIIKLNTQIKLLNESVLMQSRLLVEAKTLLKEWEHSAVLLQDHFSNDVELRNITTEFLKKCKN